MKIEFDMPDDVPESFKKALNIKMRDVVHCATCASCGELFDGEEGCIAPLQIEDGEYPIDGYCCTPCAEELNAGA